MDKAGGNSNWRPRASGNGPASVAAETPPPQIKMDKASGNWRQRSEASGNGPPSLPAEAPPYLKWRAWESQSRKSIPKETSAKATLEILEALLKETPDVLLAVLLNDTTGFSNLLDEELSHDILVRTMRIVSKICLSTSTANKAPVILIACKDNFVRQLKTFMYTLPLEEPEAQSNSAYRENEMDFWENAYVYCKTFLGKVPTFACDVLPALLKIAVNSLDHLRDFAEIQMKFKDLEAELLTRKKEEIERKESEGASEFVNNFRRISLYPTYDEITSEAPPIRRNLIKGSYENVDHYLDTHFRLLREDFVSPLRNGVCEYLKSGGKSTTLNNVKIHRNVRFLRMELVKGTRGVSVQLQRNKNRRIDYESSRRFMHGALVCFTKDNFCNLLFGKIIDRQARRLANCQVTVAIDKGTSDVVFNTNYLMLECSVYFEPYYHVLNALQHMDEVNFPMRDYLVDVVDRLLELPGYYTKYNKALELEEGYQVDLDLDNWPSPRKLNLNRSQYVAYKNALTQKFAVIQGPPGTGKTHVGLKIARTLLLNHGVWNDGPMLVVCFTNHALDQFLEGLLEVTEQIVRVGGQSKNENLLLYNLKKLRRSNRTKHFWKLLREMRHSLDTRGDAIKAQYAISDAICKYDGIVDFAYLLPLDPELSNSWFTHATPHDIANWLLRGRSQNETKQELFQLALEQARRDVEIEDADAVRVASDADDIFDTVNREENYIDLDDLMSTTQYSAKQYVSYTLRIGDILSNIEILNNELESLEAIGEVAQENLLEDVSLKQSKLFQLQNNLDYLKMRLNQGKHVQIYNKPSNIDLHSPHNITSNDRWSLYFYWLELHKKALNRDLKVMESKYHELYTECEEIRNKEDIRIMSDQLVIGMTTTGAARLHESLQQLRCPIVIVEEAAEVLEAHITASLTHHCKHLILIGDHQQLRPSTADYTMEKEYLLGISLFERMVINNIRLNTLGVQHRMRPEIAKLVVPAIYPELENHESVNSFPQVKGVDACLYFITHKHEEQSYGESSKSNAHEAEFLLKLARYLLLNGYKPEDVTILAAYSGQLSVLTDKRRNMRILKDVRITGVDNFQGEQSKIILLSLVRNNNRQSIGFLAIENRVCVALSRAREGFYMMGNINLLSAHSQIWPKVHSSLKSQNAVGVSLTLRCQNHPAAVTAVRTAQDFDEVPNGGCNKLCEKALVCGHKCTQRCHILDTDHKLYKCREKCQKIPCELNHPCPKRCWEDCGECRFVVPKTLACGHTQNVPCSEDPKTSLCWFVILTELPCKHEVSKPCWKPADTFPCTRQCDAKIDPCGHLCHFRCHFKDDPDHKQYKCDSPCEKFRAGCTVKRERHRCPNRCFEKCASCKIIVKKYRTACQHMNKVECRIDVDQMACNKPCKKMLPCGHRCKLKCKEVCGNCSKIIDKIVPACGHTVKAKCSQEPTTNMCRSKCKKMLDMPVQISVKMNAR